MITMGKKNRQPKKLPSQTQLKKDCVKQRNAVALNPLLAKSAVHQKSTKARRKADKVQLKKTWFERVAA